MDPVSTRPHVHKRPGTVVITIHGIRTYGEWQERFAELVARIDAGALCLHYKYGFFSSLSFLFPPARWLFVRKFARELAHIRADHPDADIFVLCHSFGTHLAAHAIKKLRRRQGLIHTVVLSGSVLRSDFPWNELVRGGAVKRVVNDCGTADKVLLLSQFFSPLTGMAGRVGFTGLLSRSITNRYFSGGHSHYFEGATDASAFMRNYWIPLLVDRENIASHDERRALGPMDGLLLAALPYFDGIKLLVIVAVVYLLMQVYVLGPRREVTEQKHANTVASAVRLMNDPVLGTQGAIQLATLAAADQALLRRHESALRYKLSNVKVADPRSPGDGVYTWDGASYPALLVKHGNHAYVGPRGRQHWLLADLSMIVSLSRSGVVDAYTLGKRPLLQFRRALSTVDTFAYTQPTWQRVRSSHLPPQVRPLLVGLIADRYLLFALVNPSPQDAYHGRTLASDERSPDILVINVNDGSMAIGRLPNSQMLRFECDPLSIGAIGLSGSNSESAGFKWTFGTAPGSTAAELIQKSIVSRLDSSAAAAVPAKGTVHACALNPGEPALLKTVEHQTASAGEWTVDKSGVAAPTQGFRPGTAMPVASTAQKEGLKQALIRTYLQQREIFPTLHAGPEGQVHADEEQAHFARLDEVDSSFNRFIQFVIHTWDALEIYMMPHSDARTVGAIVEIRWDYPGVTRRLLCKSDFDFSALECRRLDSQTSVNLLRSRALPVAMAVGNPDTVVSTDLRDGTTKEAVIGNGGSIIGITVHPEKALFAVITNTREIFVGDIPSTEGTLRSPRLIATFPSGMFPKNSGAELANTLSDVEFFFLGDCLITAIADTSIGCLDIHSGELVWASDVESELRLSPGFAVSNDEGIIAVASDDATSIRLIDKNGTQLSEVIDVVGQVQMGVPANFLDVRLWFDVQDSLHVEMCVRFQKNRCAYLKRVRPLTREELWQSITLIAGWKSAFIDHEPDRFREIGSIPQGRPSLWNRWFGSSLIE